MSTSEDIKDQTSNPKEEKRRDFLYLTATAMGAVGTAGALWPFLNSMNPAADTAAMATTDVDISPIQPGQAITVQWQGKPVFVRHRTEKEIEQSRSVNIDELRDKQTDDERTKEGKPQWLVMIGICTHLGCIPLGQKEGDNKGDYGGWFCPCHGSHYDSSGRIRKGPAPTNMTVPPFEFVNDTTIKIG